MKLTHVVPQQRDIEIEEVAVAFDGTDQIRVRFQQLRHYADTTALTLTLSMADWQTLSGAVEEALSEGVPNPT